MTGNKKRVLAEAAAWLEQSDRPLPEAETAAFERWMDESGNHRTAYADLATLWRSDALGEALVQTTAAASARKSARSP